MATPLTFGNLLKIGPVSYHNAKGRQIPSSTKRESTRSSARNTCTPSHRQEPTNRAPHIRELSPRRVVKQRHGSGGLSASRLGPSVDKLATMLGIDESLAFRAFDRTIIFKHWLSKTQKLALASEAFLSEKASTIS